MKNKLLLLIGVLLFSCKGKTQTTEKDENVILIEQIKSQIPEDHKIQKIDSIGLDNNSNPEYVISTTNNSNVHEYWFTGKTQTLLLSYPIKDIDYSWYINLDADEQKEIIRAQGFEDGIDYVIYDIIENTQKPILYFYPALKDDNYPQNTFWGYPWDINELVINTNNELLVSLNNQYENDGNITVPKNQNELPFIYFKGTTTQPDFKINQLNSPKELKLAQIVNAVSARSFNEDLEDLNTVSVYLNDLNLDGINDKIVVYQNLESKDNFDKLHFNLPIRLFKGESKGFSPWVENKKIIFNPQNNCIAEGYSTIVTNKNYFTIEQHDCSNYLSISTYMTFKIVGENILLHKYGEEYFDKANHDKKIPAKIWTTRSFGEVSFNEISQDMIIKLRQTDPE